jgi:hypothetical protein
LKPEKVSEPNTSVSAMADHDAKLRWTVTSALAEPATAAAIPTIEEMNVLLRI